MKIELIKFNNFKEPKRAHYNDSGADIFAAETVSIPPRSVAAIPTGVGVKLPDGYDIVVHSKSGLGKKGIILVNAPVDAGYSGEIHAIVYNSSDSYYTFEEGQKVGQLVVRPVIYAEFVDSLGEERGSGAFGSTGS